MPQGDISKKLNFQHKNGCKSHERSNLEWHYIKKIYVTRSILFVRTGLILCHSTINWYALTSCARLHAHACMQMHKGCYYEYIHQQSNKIKYE